MTKRKSNVRVSDEEESDYKAKAQDDFEDDEFESEEEPKSEDSEDSPAPKNSKGQNKNKKDDRGVTDEGDTYFQLSDKRRVTIREFKNMVLIDFREYYKSKDDGEYHPTKKGISLQIDQWNKLKELIDDIDEEIKKFE
ncbi:12273_t:CDS:2 [Gigaspora margarita]|uniref:12273_t:CDS:1 n=1 Tax=Gigaspora margarita TaxID=4874 RepID=A0ABN7UI51_GIGMA|nr:12273_t:CDS:2 [Gigaspora margarita]